ACDKTYILKDITDDGTGHLDMFFKWLAPEHVMIGRYEDSLTLDYNGDGKQQTLPMPGKVASDYANTWKLNKQRMEDNVSLFQSSKTSQGNSFTISRLTMMTRYKDQYGNLPRTFINSTFTNGANIYPSYTTKSCRAPSGKLCNQDSQCANGSHCAAGRCTVGATTRGCDELLKCSSATQCVTDPFKVALTARAQKQWQAALPTYTHIGLRADTIAGWSGAIHCITRTIPTGPVTKTVADGYCVKGTCGCVKGGANFACTDNNQCVGAARVCDCALCKGTCNGSTKSCTDDADCGQPIVDGSCVVDSTQLCPGQSSKPSSGGDVCKGVSYEGQCNGKTLNYCDQTLKSQSCNNCCGWNKSSGFYDCLNANSCQGCVDECDSSGQTGCSSKSSHSWTCTKVGGCFVRKWTKCAATCSNGTCTGGSVNQVDVCPSSPTPDTQDSGTTGSDTSAPDTSQPDTSKPDTTAGTSDSGASPQDSAGQDTQVSCQADCSGKSCGPDGCGGICGLCAGTKTCSVGQCVGRQADAGAADSACQPQCGQCGPDGCGGNCGSCDVGSICQQGACVATQPSDDANTGRTSQDGLVASDAAGSDQVQMKVIGESTGCSAQPGRKPLLPWFWSLACAVGLIWWRKKRTLA
ncbi:MAG: hypothetical protein CMH53_01965, partial [Myxococcales bacterium]|nr:hypothetical protein [Myxococcales bacterium]